MFSANDATVTKHVVHTFSDFDGTLSDIEGAATVKSNAYKEATNIPSVVEAKKEIASNLESKLLPGAASQLMVDANAYIQQIELLVQHYTNKVWNHPQDNSIDELTVLTSKMAAEKAASMLHNAREDIARANVFIDAAQNPAVNPEQIKRAIAEARKYALSAKNSLNDLELYIAPCHFNSADEHDVFIKEARGLSHRCYKAEEPVKAAAKAMDDLLSKLKDTTQDDTYQYLNSTEETVKQDREIILSNIRNIMSRAGKPQGYESFTMRESAIDFIKQAIAAENSKLYIVSKNHRAYIEAVLMYNGFTREQIDKIAVKDINNGGENKEACVFNILRQLNIKDPTSITILILDDSPREVHGMEQGAAKCGLRDSLLSFQEKPGHFAFEDITSQLIDCQQGINTVNELSQGGFDLSRFNDSVDGGVRFSHSGSSTLFSPESNGESTSAAQLATKKQIK